MKNELVPVHGKVNALYRRMQTAVAECYSIDDCREIANQANAIAAYYSQIKDNESVRKFLQVKLRAWRRISEILTGSADRSGCNTVADYIRKIKRKFDGRKDIEDLPDHAFRQAIKLAEVPADFFEKTVMKSDNINDIVGAFASFKHRLWSESAEGKAELKRREAEMVRNREHYAEQEQARQAEEAAKQAKLAERQSKFAEFEKIQEEAFKEVGITLDRRYRKDMKQVVFLIKDSIYETLRQAAFDNRITMQSILRSGLIMWFIAHGYKIGPIEDMHLNERAQAQEHRMGRSANR